MHDDIQLFELTAVLLTALAAGLLMIRLKQPPLVGYILTGMILGPSALAMVENREAIRFLAELGAILLMFVIGIELSLRVFRRIYKLTMLIVALQIFFGLLICFAIGLIFDWSDSRTIVLGFAVALSSTAVGVNMLDEVGELHSSIGRLTVGILIAQDLAVVPMLIITQSIGKGNLSDPLALIKVLGAVIFLVGFVTFMSGRKKLVLPFETMLGHAKGFTTIAALTICFLFATISGYVGITTAFGAFIAGLFIGNSQQRHQFLQATLPIRDILLMVFFLSIGLLIDLKFVSEHLLELGFLVFFIFLLKTLGNLFILRVVGQPRIRSIRVATILPQIGEFSFILGATAFASGALNLEGYRLLVTLIAMTLIASPVWLASARSLSNARWILLLVNSISLPIRSMKIFRK